MWKGIIVVPVLVVLWTLILLVGFNQLPDSIVYLEYGTGECLFVDIVEENQWTKISCSEFEARGGFDTEYETQWGSLNY